jgi:hypothetical protein
VEPKQQKEGIRILLPWNGSECRCQGRLEYGFYRSCVPCEAIPVAVASYTSVETHVNPVLLHLPLRHVAHRRDNRLLPIRGIWPNIQNHRANKESPDTQAILDLNDELADFVKEISDADGH